MKASTLRALGLVSLSLAAARPHDAATGPAEYEVKAAYLYNFARFVEWPDTAQGEGPFIITVLGRDPFGAALDDTLRGKTVGQKRIAVRRVSRPDEIGGSRIVFISDSEKDRLPDILKTLEAMPVLTVGDMHDFAERGGTIRFRVERQRVRLDINVAAAERARLRISSQLLKLARIVGRRETGS